LYAQLPLNGAPMDACGVAAITGDGNATAPMDRPRTIATSRVRQRRSRDAIGSDKVGPFQATSLDKKSERSQNAAIMAPYLVRSNCLYRNMVMITIGGISPEGHALG
jgi:hypothetical protein